MQNDLTDRSDLCRLADDGCPHATGDTRSHDLSELWAVLGKDDYETE
ncbi:hypothetical protein J8F10_09815 [Gemmata sp. G18]|uniref:Uncharacterized protein n=1 Tax=Gemmata palustris TaxID=2822762 RepID=A0ABS5BPE5_9BACT|nr:hypothetical protein [Gemmata palustris]MBP3955577.1 hypothetical protein [Gemmata palustris]